MSDYQGPTSANGYEAIPLPLPGLPPPPQRQFQKLAKKPRALAFLKRLKLIYPKAPCSLDYETPVQLMVSTMLAAQCTDARVNQVTPALFERFPDAAAMAGAEVTELEELVRSTGFYRNKAKNIQAAAHKIVTEFGGAVPGSMAELITLPGVARKTANVVLAHAFGIHEGVTVDTHVKRISGRMGLTKHADPPKIEQDLMKLLPQDDWENWSIRLVYHGRGVCMARSPNCLRCDLLDICPGAAKIQKEADKAAKAKAKKNTAKRTAKKSAAKKATAKDRATNVSEKQASKKSSANAKTKKS